MQGTCDYKGRFLDVSIGHPGSTSDFLAFDTSILKHRLENGLLAPGLVILGDNAYCNSSYLATPFKNVKVRGDEDNYNFYHSSLRIRIECAFGMLVNRWGILRRPIPSQITLPKVTSMVMCLCSLHNWCIENNQGIPAEPTCSDQAEIFMSWQNS